MHHSLPIPDSYPVLRHVKNVFLQTFFVCCFFSGCQETVVETLVPDPRYRVDQFSGVSVADQQHAYQMILHRYWNTPVRGADAPDGILVDAETGNKFRLHDLVHEKPAVLIFGSASCSQVELFTTDFEVLCDKFGDRVDFYFVYIREAHPKGGFQPLQKRDSIETDATVCHDSLTIDERRNAAMDLRNKTGDGMRYLVDSMDDAVAARWAAWPSRAYVVGADRKILYVGGQGPFYFHLTKGSWHDPPPEELENVLRRVPFDEQSLEDFLETLPKAGS